MNAEEIKNLLQQYLESIQFADGALEVFYAIDEMQQELDATNAEIFKLRNETEEQK